MNGLLHFKSYSLRRGNILRSINAPTFKSSITIGQKLFASGTTKESKTMAKITLADGTVFHGISFGAEKPVAGEVVFSTGMVGYTESLTDPSFRGQVNITKYIVCLLQINNMLL